MTSSLMPPKFVATCTTNTMCYLLAECDVEILVVGLDNTISTTKLLVYRLADLAAGKFVPVPNIGGNTLFLDIKMSTDMYADHICFVRSMTSRSRAMPAIASDTTVHHYKGYPWQYDLVPAYGRK